MQLDENMPIQLSINLGKTNMILGALSKMPFEQVANIITEIQQQAGPQVMEAQAKAGPQPQPVPPEAPQGDAANGPLADKVKPV